MEEGIDVCKAVLIVGMHAEVSRSGGKIVAVSCRGRKELNAIGGERIGPLKVASIVSRRRYRVLRD